MRPKHDIEGFFHLYDAPHPGARRTPVLSGYRPIHRLRDDYLSSGLHEYPDVAQVSPGETAKVLAWFITPECHPGSLWIDRELDVMEGSRVIGKLTVTRILNSTLEASSEAHSPQSVDSRSATVKPDDQLDRPYEEWAQHQADDLVPWKDRLFMMGAGALFGVLLDTAIYWLIAVTRPDIPAWKPWSSLAFIVFCAFYGLVAGWKR